MKMGAIVLGLMLCVASACSAPGNKSVSMPIEVEEIWYHGEPIQINFDRFHARVFQTRVMSISPNSVALSGVYVPLKVGDPIIAMRRGWLTDSGKWVEIGRVDEILPEEMAISVITYKPPRPSTKPNWA